MDNGWIKLHRKLLDSEIFASQIGLKIWLWSLMKASHKKRFIPIRIGKGETTVAVEKGSFIFGRNSASRELNINGSTVYKWMQKLQDMGMISIESNNQYSIITICNYVDYQKNEKDEVTAIGQPLDNQVTATQQPRDTYKKVKNVEKVKNNTPIFSKEKTIATPVKILHVDVEEVYKKYPTKCLIRGASTGKGAKDKTKIKALLKQYSKNELLETIELYVNDCVSTSTYMKNFSTFLNNLPSIESFEGSNSNHINNKNNGNNQITAKERQRQQVAVDVGQGILQRFYDEQNQQNDL